MINEKPSHSSEDRNRREAQSLRIELVPETNDSDVIMGDGQLGGDTLDQAPDGQNPEGSMQLPVCEPAEGSPRRA
jgi:hypothetical protein